jgi:hypothetical protein
MKTFRQTNEFELNEAVQPAFISHNRYNPAALRQTNQRIGLFTHPRSPDHLFVCLDWCCSCEQQAAAGA